MTGWRVAGSGLAVAMVFVAAATGEPLAGQGFSGLVVDCAGANVALVERCHQAALALDAARGGLALAASAGNDVPGSASTLGFRLRRFPRVSLSGRIGMARVSVPDILDGYGVATDEDSFFLPAAQFTGIVGLFDGFSTAPTVGGILALDVTASRTQVFLPGDEGFQGSAGGWGLGARLGLLRESFNLPGISLTASRRWMGDTQLGSLDAGDPAEARFGTRVTSYRAVIGKDIAGIGFVAGGGWDRIRGDGAIGVRTSPSGGVEAGASAKGLFSERAVLFGGASWTFLILQLSGEVGWSEGRNPPLSATSGGTVDPDLGAWFASAALRLTF